MPMLQGIAVGQCCHQHAAHSRPRCGDFSKVKRHLFVSREHPDSDASIGQALDGLRHAGLQLVLDGSAAQQQQVALYQVPDCCKLLLSPCQGCLGLEVLLLPPVAGACSCTFTLYAIRDSAVASNSDTDNEDDHDFGQDNDSGVNYE